MCTINVSKITLSRKYINYRSRLLVIRRYSAVFLFFFFFCTIFSRRSLAPHAISRLHIIRFTYNIYVRAFYYTLNLAIRTYCTNTGKGFYYNNCIYQFIFDIIPLALTAEHYKRMILINNTCMTRIGPGRIIIWS